jgi:oxygen-independent coproporphyrinogen-3 oxidase
MLELRLSEGLPLDALDADGVREAHAAAADGLLEPSFVDNRAVLTDRGRLLADGVVRRLTL